jgi:large subunit ribosomal protein L32
MANPKRRHSKQRGRLRRTHYKASDQALNICPQCSKGKQSHKVCVHCGYYKGRPVVSVKSVKEKKQERENKKKK